MSVPYRDVSRLVTDCRKGQDFDIYIVDQGSQITAVAIHGGRIEPLVSELAADVAAETYNLYDFRGIRGANNEQLRVPVSRFSEMRLGALMRRSHAALLIDGVQGEDALVHLGGGNRDLRHLLDDSLRAAGFAVESPHSPGAAHDPRRLYNLSEAGGVQMELSLALRRELVGGPLEPSRWPEPQRYTERYQALTSTIRETLVQYLAEVRSDLDTTMERFERSTERFPPWMRGDHHRHGNEE